MKSNRGLRRWDGLADQFRETQLRGGFGGPFFYDPFYYGYYPYYYPYGYGYGFNPYNQPVYQGSVVGTGSSVREVQRRLARAGYYHGRIDGVMGPRTRDAIRAFQRSHNMRVTAR